MFNHLPNNVQNSDDPGAAIGPLSHTRRAAAARGEPCYYARADGLPPSFLMPDQENHFRLLDPDSSDLEIYGPGEGSDGIVLLATVELPSVDVLVGRGGRCRVPVRGVPQAFFNVDCALVQSTTTGDRQLDPSLPVVEMRISYSLARSIVSAPSQMRSGTVDTQGSRRVVHPQVLNAALVVLSTLTVSGFAYQTGRVREFEIGARTRVVGMDGLNTVADGRRMFPSPVDLSSFRNLQANALPASLTVSLSDMNEDAREQARLLRRRDSYGSDPIRQVASARALRAELVDKGLGRALIDAQGYVMGGAVNGDEEAVTLYSSVVEQLSQGARATLHQATLAAAMSAARAGQLEEAALQFQAVFADYMLPE